ncbi:MAG: hypothetical protein PHE67_05745 [Campylobacterales bacterium]|nr:hypothetical protein [Campylobacterales bacterium]
MANAWFVPQSDGTIRYVVQPFAPSGALSPEQARALPGAVQKAAIDAYKAVPITTVLPASSSSIGGSTIGSTVSNGGLVGSISGNPSVGSGNTSINWTGTVVSNSSKLVGTALKFLGIGGSLYGAYDTAKNIYEGAVGASTAIGKLWDVATGVRDPNTGEIIKQSQSSNNVDNSSTSTSPQGIIPNQSTPPRNVNPSTGNTVPTGGSTGGGSTGGGSTGGGSTGGGSTGGGSAADPSLPLYPQTDALNLISVLAASSDRQVLALSYLSKTIEKTISKLPQLFSAQSQKDASTPRKTSEDPLESIRNAPQTFYGGFDKSMLNGLSGVAFGSSPVASSGSASSFGGSNVAGLAFSSSGGSSNSSSPINATSQDIKNNSSTDEINRVVAALQAKNLELQNKILEYQTTPQTITPVDGAPSVSISPVSAEFMSNVQDMKYKGDLNNEFYDDDDFGFDGLDIFGLPFKGVSGAIISLQSALEGGSSLPTMSGFDFEDLYSNLTILKD